MNLINKETWELFCPNRVGDCIMSLPATICLSLLVPNSIELILVNNKNITPLIQQLNLLPCRTFTTKQKLNSWLQPKAKAIFYNTQSQHQFYRAKQTMGWPNKGKKLSQWLNRYNLNLHGIRPVEGKQKPFAEFSTKLQTEFGFSADIIHYFGILLGLNFSEEDILKVLPTALEKIKISSKQIINTQNHIPGFHPQSNYFTVCLEAAYGSNRADNRRWPAGDFWQVIEHTTEQNKLKAVLLGLETNEKVPNRIKENVIDLRKQLSLEQTAFIQQNALFHLGNDSGLTHLANLMQTPTITIYLATQSHQYGPIFNALNTSIQSPQTTKQVIDVITSTLKTPLESRQ